MSASFHPFEARTLIYGLYIDECIQVSISTLLVYDTCEYKNTLIAPFSTTLNTVITFDKEASTMISVEFILMHFLQIKYLWVLIYSFSNLNSFLYLHYTIDESVAQFDSYYVLSCMSIKCLLEPLSDFLTQNRYVGVLGATASIFCKHIFIIYLQIMNSK